MSSVQTDITPSKRF